MGGLEFSCGEDSKLVPAVTTAAEQKGPAPDEFVQVMTNALRDARYGVGKASPTVTLEHLKLPVWRPSVLEVPSSPTSSLKWKKAVSQTKPASRTFLNSPRSVHVCMEFGVDPLSLLERDFASFKEKGVSEDLQRTAYQHHLAGRTKTLDSLIAARVNLEPDFSPPSLAMDHDAASFVTKSTPPGENSADAELKKRIVLDEAKRAKHSLKMDANRLAELAGEEKLQAEFAEKAGKVAARRRVLQTKAVLGEKQRTAAQVAKNTQQKAAAEVYETDERAEALKRVEEETARRAMETQDFKNLKKHEEWKRLESRARDTARAGKTRALHLKKEVETEALRHTLEKRAERLREYEKKVKTERDAKRTERGPNLGGTLLKLSVAKNLLAQNALDEKKKQDLVQQRLQRESNAALFRLNDRNDTKMEQLTLVASTKRAKVASALAAVEKARLEKFHLASAKHETHARKLAAEKKAVAAKVTFERVLRQNDRTERVQNQERVNAVARARLGRKITSDAERVDTLVDAKSGTAAARQLENCRVGLARSLAQVENEEILRKQTRARWLKTQQSDLELEARIVLEAETKERLAGEQIVAAEAAAAVAQIAAAEAAAAAQIAAKLEATNVSRDSSFSARSEKEYVTVKQKWRNAMRASSFSVRSTQNQQPAGRVPRHSTTGYEMVTPPEGSSRTGSFRSDMSLRSERVRRKSTLGCEIDEYEVDADLSVVFAGGAAEAPPPSKQAPAAVHETEGADVDDA